MTATRRAFAIALSAMLSLSSIWAQSVSIEPVRPKAPIFWRPYLAADVPPVRLANSPRIRDLTRAGNLYLTVQDAIALTLENNLDIEVARYNPILSAWQLERSQAGGALPGVTSLSSQAGAVASGQGVAGSEAAAGVISTGGNTAKTTTANSTVSQVGPVAQTLDPIFQESQVFSHTTTPQFDAALSLTSVLVQTTHVYTGSYQQGYLAGGSVTVTYNEHYLSENAPSDVLNPTVAPTFGILIQQNLLQGFGVAVNARAIEVAKINLRISDLNLKTQVINSVVQTLNAYFVLVADYEDIKAKQSALELAQSLYADNKKQVEVGSLAPLDLTTAESQVASSERDLVVSETTLRQHEVQLKDLMSRNGSADPAVRDLRIVPLDGIVMSEKDDLPPIQSMLRQAVANRADLAAEKLNLQSAEVNAVGTKNGMLPVLEPFAEETEAGLAGVRRTVTETVPGPNGAPITITATAPPSLAGGMGTALGDIFRRNYPTDLIGGFFQANIFNRQAQGDYGIDQLSIRQTQLLNQKDINQMQVDLMNAVVALRQSRARYEAAVKNHVLEQQLLDSERKKYALGASTPYLVAQQQRDLAAAQSTEIAALVSWNNARIALDQVLGTTLETNHVSLAEARAGKVQRVSAPPSK